MNCYGCCNQSQQNEPLPHCNFSESKPKVQNYSRITPINQRHIQYNLHSQSSLNIINSLEDHKNKLRRQLYNKQHYINHKFGYLNHKMGALRQKYASQEKILKGIVQVIDQNFK